LKPATLAKHIADFALTKKAQDVVLMNLKGLSSVTDFFVVCSADSDVQVRAIATAVEEGLKGKGVRPWQVERGSPNWVVLDYVDVVLHVFHKHTRPFYNLEKLWGDAVIVRVEDGEVRPVRRPAPGAPKQKAAKPKTKKAASQRRTPKPRRKSSARVSPRGKSNTRRRAAS
jgi:ribosome-associated protein